MQVAEMYKSWLVNPEVSKDEPDELSSWYVTEQPVGPTASHKLLSADVV